MNVKRRPPPSNQIEEEARFRIFTLLRERGNTKLNQTVFLLTMAGLAWADILQRIVSD